MINVELYTLSTPPEMEIEDSFYNKVACYVPLLGVCDFMQIDVKGVKAGHCYPAQIEFVSSAKRQTVKVVSIDVEKGLPFEIKVKK